jgi:hypothetical protein
MKTVFFLLLRLICYPALLVVVAAAIVLVVVRVNGQCPPLTGIGVTCATRLSQGLADFSLAVGGFTLDTGLPLVLAAGGLIFLFRDVLRRKKAS